MAMRFQCPNCQAVRAVNPRLLGREIPCPDCGHSVALPTAEQMAVSRQQSEQEYEAERALQEKLGRLNQFLSQPSDVRRQEVFAGGESEEDAQARMSAEERALAAATTRFTRPKPKSGEDMDMTPMVDVTFLLLIFFMITASFSVQKSIQRPAQRNDDPSTQAVQTTPDENADVVTVQVDEFNAYSIITVDWDRVASSKQDLIVALNEAHEGSSGGARPSKLVVQAHENCIHAAVIAALDAGREAQFESFEVDTVEQFD